MGDEAERTFLDFNKLDPGMKEFISELQQEVKKAKAESADLKRILEAKPSPPNVRNLSRRDYTKAKTEVMRTIIRQERERRDATILTNLTNVDVRKMSPEQYKELEKKLSRRS